MNAPQEDAQAITRASKSNLALAFVALPRERRDDIAVFYAWCRVIDDVADDPGIPAVQRREALAQWKAALAGPQPGEPPLAVPVRALVAKYRLPLEHFCEILAGVEMDLDGASYATWEDLRLYCYRVASAVGLVSIAIFGCRAAGSREYAITLGLALQLTNILRDVGEDWRNGGRLYLPREEFARFGCTAADLEAGRFTPELGALLHFEAARARDLFARAVELRPVEDRRALVAAEIMRGIYRRLLGRMERDGFQKVLSQRYRLSGLEKLSTIVGTVARSIFP